jgi:hypoxanthine phosphoribosyltransferase
MTTVTMLFDAEQIARRVDELAREIRQKVGSRDLALVGILKGSFMFMADLARALERADARPQIEFMRLASYGQKKESSGEVLLLGDAPRDFEGRPVVVVDDIVDTGLSMDYGRELLAGRNVAAVHTCALLDKPSRRNVDIVIDFVGFTIPDVFVVGYGIDYAEQYRYLPYIGKVD